MGAEFQRDESTVPVVCFMFSSAIAKLLENLAVVVRLLDEQRLVMNLSGENTEKHLKRNEKKQTF